MTKIRRKVVTLKSLLPAPGSAVESTIEAASAGEKELTPEEQQMLARYQQIVRRVRQETQTAGSDVIVTVPNREVSLAQSKLAEENETDGALAAGGQEVKFGTGPTARPRTIRPRSIRALRADRRATIATNPSCRRPASISSPHRVEPHPARLP